MKAMTAQEFLAYWLTPDEHGRSLLSYNEESIGEHQAEFDGEVARFGDAGPGAGLRLREMKQEHAQVVRLIAKLEAKQ